MFKMLLAQKLQAEKGQFSCWIQYSQEGKKKREYEYWLRIKEAIGFELPRRLAYLNQVVDHPELSVFIVDDPKAAVANAKKMIKVLEKNAKVYSDKAQKELIKLEKKMTELEVKKANKVAAVWLQEYIDGVVVEEKTKKTNNAPLDLSAFIHIGKRQLSML